MKTESMFPEPAPWLAGPMLLQRFVPGLATWPAVAEEKVNGVRCLVIVDEKGQGRAYSREGNPLPVQALADRIAAAGGPGVYDGELAAGTWNETISLLKRRGADRSALIFHCFDALTPQEWAFSGSLVPWCYRRWRLDVLHAVPGVRVLPGVQVDGPDEVEALFRVAIADRWEGLVIKDPQSGYYCGERTRAWLKLKEGRLECW